MTATKALKTIKTTKSKQFTAQVATKTPQKLVITSDNKNDEKNIKTSYSVENNIKSNFAKGKFIFELELIK